MMPKAYRLVLLFSVLAAASVGCTSTAGSKAKQVPDDEYARLVKEATTRPEFISPLVDHLPKVAGVPTPKDSLGYIAGAPGHLTYYEDIVKYMNALAQAVSNVK